jgi:GT2 family glycosyltransferase
MSSSRFSFPVSASRRKASKRPAQLEVSVCIANWSCKHQLAACLESLTPEHQDVSLEVVVVDNASPDGAADLVERDYPHVTLIRNERNRGFARANNQAARRARGQYLFFLNNDTVVPPGTLRRLVNFARVHPEVGIVGPRLCDDDDRPQVSFRKRPTVAALLHRTCLLRWTGLFRRAYQRYRQRTADFETTRPVEVLMGAALLMRRRVFFECGPWDEDYEFGGEDMDLCTRVARFYPVVYHPDVAITHLGRMSSRRNIGYAHASTVIGITHFLRKTGTPLWQLMLYKTVLTLDLPLQWLVAGGQYLWRRLTGQRVQAARSLLVLRGVGHFLTRGLLRFWRA